MATDGGREPTICEAQALTFTVERARIQPVVELIEREYWDCKPFALVKIWAEMAENIRRLSFRRAGVEYSEKLAGRVGGQLRARARKRLNYASHR